MTRLDEFKAALIDLCRRHGVSIHTSGYDCIEVWPLRDNEDDFLAINEMDWHPGEGDSK